MGLRPITPRQALLVAFAVATLVLIVVGALASISLLRTSLDHVAEHEAGREANVATDMGLAAALSHGDLSPRDLQIAASQYAAARRDLPLTGATIWLPSGRAIFARGSGRVDALHPESRVATAALRTGRTRVADVTDPSVGPVLEAAVPLGRRALDAVVELHFTRRGLQRTLGQAEQRLYELAGIAALTMFLAILPFLGRLASRVPLPVDPVRRAALAELEGALDRHEFVLHYQPKTEIESGRVVGVEALVRWNHRDRGLLGPGQFLPLAESSPELLKALTCQVLECAVRDCAAWRVDGHELPVAVNVAPAVLLGAGLVDLVQSTLRRHCINPRMLILELTESALMEPEDDVTEQLRELRDLGVSVSIDDFGTGNSSLSRLRSLPLDELKIDRSFISGISTDERDLGITRHIVNLGIELGLRVVAEGVEDERTLRVLRTLRCEVAQGFHLGRPMPDHQLRSWLAGRETPRPAETLW